MAPQKDRGLGSVGDLTWELLHLPCLLRPSGDCRLGGWLVSGSREVPRGWRKEGGRLRLCPADPLARVPPGYLCMPGTAPFPPYGSHWRMVAVPGRPETASSALRRGESKAEWGNYRQPCTSLAQTSSLYSQCGSELCDGKDGAEAVWGDRWGEGQSALTGTATWALQKMQGQLAPLALVQGSEGGLVSFPQRVCGFCRGGHS